MASFLLMIPINFILLPLFLLLFAVLLIAGMEKLEKLLPENSRLRNWLCGSRSWKNPYWLRNRIDLILITLFVILLVLVTVIYS